MASSSLERTLRISTLFSSVFGIAILAPATVKSAAHWNYYWDSRLADSVIGFGFIPLFFTVGTSILYLAAQRLRKDKTTSSSHPLLWFVTDVLIFGGYMVALVFEWVVGMWRLNNWPDDAFLEAYATVPLMVNMTIHFVTLSINLRAAFRSLLAKTAVNARACPHCHHRIDAGHHEEVAQKGTGEGYSLLRGEEYDDDAPRASASEDRVALPTVEEV